MDHYPTSNSALIESLKLQKHVEGGYFVETDRQSVNVSSPFAADEPRSLATAIYYLLTYDRPDGLFHLNKSVTYHVLHQGRAEYTLITPVPGRPPRIEIKVMGIGSGEHRQLLVGTGIWKKSRILPEDIALGKSDQDRDKVGCLITEVVVPGFHWEDHAFMRKQNLEDLFNGVQGGEKVIAEFEKYVKND